MTSQSRNRNLLLFGGAVIFLFFLTWAMPQTGIRGSHYSGALVTGRGFPLQDYSQPVVVFLRIVLAFRVVRCVIILSAHELLFVLLGGDTKRKPNIWSLNEIACAHVDLDFLSCSRFVLVAVDLFGKTHPCVRHRIFQARPPGGWASIFNSSSAWMYFIGLSTFVESCVNEQSMQSAN